MTRPVLVVDVETCGRDECRQWVKPAANLKDPAKIAASIEERAEKLSVDINGARIVVLGYLDSRTGDPAQFVIRSVKDEADALTAFWLAWQRMRAASVNAQLAGFRSRTFDLPLIIRRSQLLGVTPEHVSLARYGRGDVLDLYDELCFHETQNDRVVPCSLDVFCQQFGIDVEDDIDGADVPALVAAGNLEAVRAHNYADLLRTAQLGARLNHFACRLPALV